VQSAFKYDHSPAAAQEAIATLRGTTPGAAADIDQEGVRDLVRRYGASYAEQVAQLSGVVYETTPFIPARRRRKLHVGLFGYARTMRGVALPRAIGFTAGLYSVGLPPEVLGLDALTEADLESVRRAYVNFDDDLRDAVRYLNPDTGLVPEALLRRIDDLGLKPGEEDEHRWITGRVAELLRGHDVHEMRRHVLRAASLRRFLG
jgi:phosphoenolpyruvate carboxylase